MSQYTLKVHVDHSQYPTLKASHYRLCVAKMVNQMYTVVWSGDDFLQNNTFQWTEEYEVFGQENFTVGALVQASTDPQHIKYGQTCELNADGDLKPATGAPDKSGSFTVKNEFGAIHAGVNGRLGGKFSPIFVSPNVVSGDVVLQPVIQVKVWFDLHLQTGSMILDSTADNIEVVYEGGVEQNISYQGPKPGLGSWNLMQPDT